MNPFGEEEARWTIVAMVGGAARYLHLWLKPDESKPFRWLHLVATMVGAGFFGFMAGSTAEVMGYTHWAFVAAGLGGFIGDRTIDLIFSIISRHKQ